MAIDSQEHHDDAGVAADAVGHRVGQGAHRAGRGHGDDPGRDHASGHVPAHLGAPADARTQDGAGRHLGGRQRVAEVAGQQDGRRRRRLRRHPLRRLDLGQALAHGPDDPPAADPRAQADGQGAGHDHPRGCLGTRGEGSVGDQGQGDDAHGLLGVVGAVGQRHHGGRADLPEPEPVGRVPLGTPLVSR